MRVRKRHMVWTEADTNYAWSKLTFTGTDQSISLLFWMRKDRCNSPLYLLPLVDVADESGEAQEAQQAEDLGEADDPQGSRCFVKVWVDACLHDEEDVVDGDGGDEVHHEPALQVLDLDLLGVQDDLRVVLFHDPRAEVEDQIHEEESVRHNVEDDPGRRVLVFKEGDAHGDDDQVSHHQQQHRQVPVKPETPRRGEAFTHQNKKLFVSLHVIWQKKKKNFMSNVWKCQ